jgi:BlaI family penicillinase repressor
MARHTGKKLRLGDLQLRILQVLWQRGAASVADVHQVLSEQSPFAYTTIATMLTKMEARRLVTHEAEGRRFIYKAAVDADAVSGSMISEVLDGFFAGSLSSMVHHLLETREVDVDELRRLERLLAERRKRS